MIFDDPPVGRIEEVEEPDSCEEGVVVGEIDEGSDDEESWERELPFYGQDMDATSGSRRAWFNGRRVPLADVVW